MHTAKMLMLQYDFKTAVPLIQVVRDYYNSTLTEREIKTQAKAGKFPFACYQAENKKNSQTDWFVTIESLAEWIDKKKQEATKDYLALHKK